MPTQWTSQRGGHERFLKSLWLQLAGSTQERLRGKPLFQFLRTFENFETKIRLLMTPHYIKRIYRIRDNIPIYERLPI